MKIKVIVKGQEIKMSRREFLKKYGKEKRLSYDDKMIQNREDRPCW